MEEDEAEVAKKVQGFLEGLMKGPIAIKKQEVAPIPMDDQTIMDQGENILNKLKDLQMEGDTILIDETTQSEIPEQPQLENPSIPQSIIPPDTSIPEPITQVDQNIPSNIPPSPHLISDIQPPPPVNIPKPPKSTLMQDIPPTPSKNEIDPPEIPQNVPISSIEEDSSQKINLVEESAEIFKRLKRLQGLISEDTNTSEDIDITNTVPSQLNMIQSDRQYPILPQEPSFFTPTSIKPISAGPTQSEPQELSTPEPQEPPQAPGLFQPPTTEPIQEPPTPEPQEPPQTPGLFQPPTAEPLQEKSSFNEQKNFPQISGTVQPFSTDSIMTDQSLAEQHPLEKPFQDSQISLENKEVLQTKITGNISKIEIDKETESLRERLLEMRSEIQEREQAINLDLPKKVEPVPIEKIKVEEITLDEGKKEPILDEKEELIAMIKKELPKLPKKKIKYIVQELMKRPKGRLRNTWFKVYVHKNKQYQ
ncbi:MAG: hypothetical protein ACTSUG_09935 [Candidatus Helarchaeota archaeon]